MVHIGKFGCDQSGKREIKGRLRRRIAEIITPLVQNRLNLRGATGKCSFRDDAILLSSYFRELLQNRLDLRESRGESSFRDDELSRTVRAAREQGVRDDTEGLPDLLVLQNRLNLLETRGESSAIQ